jgi:hypothetical protein
MSTRPVLFAAFLFAIAACDPDGSTPETAACNDTLAGTDDDPIALGSLACLTRVGEPVLRDPIPGENYETASDGHVFRDAEGTLRMIFSGDADGHIGIKLATGSDWDAWTVDGTLLDPSMGTTSKETAFYRLADDGTHQIFYIGYEDEDAYQADIYLAEAPALTGPWTIRPEPVVARGMQADRDVYLMTSPSVVAHDGMLYMAWLGWNDRPSDVSEVWVLGATSTDDGRTWTDIREVDVPIGMEGQLTAGPDGRFYATRTGEIGNTEGIGIGVADHPFGPYTTLDAPVLVKAGAPWEVDESIAPQLTFDPETRTAYLYYAGADYAVGWWMMLATAPY